MTNNKLRAVLFTAAAILPYFMPAASALDSNGYKGSDGNDGDNSGEVLSGTTPFSNIRQLIIGNLVDTIPSSAFAGNENLVSVTFGSSIKTIGDEAFSGCTGLKGVILSPSVETIGASAFAGASQLGSIIMGHNVKVIGEKAFDGCPASTISITAQTPPTAPNNTFSSYTGKLWLQGKGAVDAYYDAFTCWDRFNGYVMVEATGLKYDGENNIVGEAGDQFQLHATLMPDDVTLPQVFWRSTNPEIATVDENGLVTLHANLSEVLSRAAADDESGKCTIIAESLYANGPLLEVTIQNTDFSDIDEIEVDGESSTVIDYNEPIEVYNLRGMKVGVSTEGLASGIYIVRQGAKIEKIAI